MAFDYNRTAATSLRLLQQFGTTATIKRETVGAYDPDLGTAPVTEELLPTTACVFAYEQKYIDGTLILQGDQLAYCAPTEEPKQGDKLTWLSKDYEIVSVKPISPAGIPVLYEAQIRA